MTTETLTLTYGPHKSPEEGMCLMEAVAYLSGERHSDHPECACPVIAAYARALNDKMGEGAEGDALRTKHLLPHAKKLVGTRSAPEVSKKRALYFADRAVRLFAPSALESAGLTEEAETLRSLAEVVDEQTAHAAARIARSDAAYDVAGAARAADAAAWAAEAAEAAAGGARAAAWAAEAAEAAAGSAADAAAGWEQAAQVLAEACEIGIERGG